MPLDYNNSIPLYVQLKEELKQNIKNGKYQEKIPSERVIMEEYYVSRSTVRQAVEELVDDGILVKKPGKGTFIALKPIDDWLGNLSSTTETIERMGLKAGIKLLHADIVTLSPYMQKKTGLQKAYHFKRLRFANEIPIGIENHFYTIPLGEKLMNFDLNKETIYDLLESKLGIHTFEADQEIRAGKPGKSDAELLEIDTNDAVLITNRKLFDMDQEFVEYEHAIYRSDMYSFKIRLSRKN